MKVFIIKSIALLGIVLSIFLLIAKSYKPHLDPENDFMAVMIDKYKRLQEAGNNRLILVGGSNLAFGINSEKLENELHTNVVNLGLHGGLGLEFILNEAIHEVKSGDVIILSIEYSLYDPKNKEVNLELIDQTQQLFPESKAYYVFNINDLAFLNYRNFKKSFQHSSPGTTSIYNRKSFNKWGDFVAHLDKQNMSGISHEGKLKSIESIGSLNKFKELSEKCKTVGAKVFLTFPAYLDVDYELSKNEIQQLEELIKKELNFIPIITDPKTFMYDASHFFDTSYHLNAKGRERRTDTLIHILKKNL